MEWKGVNLIFCTILNNISTCRKAALARIKPQIKYTNFDGLPSNQLINIYLLYYNRLLCDHVDISSFYGSGFRLL